MQRVNTTRWLLAALLCAAPARADVWDLGADSDNDTGSDNEIVHGLDQIHDVAAQAGGTVEDVDWYVFRQPFGRSYEIRVDGMTGDVSNGGSSPALQRIATDGVSVEQDSDPVTNFGVARSLRAYVLPNLAALERVVFIRVSNPACGLTCVASDRYRIRALDTTLSLPRFNNANGQVSVLILQNPTARNVQYTLGVLSNAGALLGTVVAVLAPYATAVHNLSTLAGGMFNNTSGSLVVAHDAPYGSLVGKAVAVEPATGFTFDTALSSTPK